MISNYVLLTFPEVQDVMEHPRFESECFLCTGIDNDNILYYAVPKDLYEKMTYKPKTYNTSLGEIICYSLYALVKDTDEMFWYDSEIERGDKVLVYNGEDFFITTCKACSYGLPVILEDSSLLPGMNCEIIGKKEEWTDQRIQFH